jgi:hypothetical protein
MLKRNNYQPSGGEVTRVRNEMLKNALSPQPSTKLDNVKEVRATLKSEKISLTGDQEDISVQMQMVGLERWDEQRTHMMSETAQGREYRNTIVWLYRVSNDAEETFPEVVRSEYIIRPGAVDERNADRDVLQFLRAERKKSEINRERTAGMMKDALMDGTFIFRGRPVPVRQEGEVLETAIRSMLSKVAREVFHQHHLVKIRPSTNLAEQFLGVERLDRMTRERDPLQFVTQQGGSPRVDINHPALAETLRAFKEKADQSGGQLDGKFIQDFFATDPYGWSKDAARYLFAALLVAGEIEFHADGQIIRTASPVAMESVKSTVAFNRVGVGIRGSKPNLEVLNRAALRIQEIFGDATILPLEDKISQAARKHFPRFIEQVGALPDRLRLLSLTGEERARALIATLTELLRGDASEAAARLGGTDTTLVENIRWAREASRALDNDGESDLRQARRLMANLSELEQYSPGLRANLDIEDRLQMLSAVNQSERFYELLPDVRTTLQVATERMQAQLSKLSATYLKALEKAQAELESMPEWRNLQDADRADIASRLMFQPPAVTALAEILNSYKTVLFQYNGLANRLNSLRNEVLLLGVTVEKIEEDVESVSLVSIRPESVISTPSELETWLQNLRQRLLEHLQAGKKIRLD